MRPQIQTLIVTAGIALAISLGVVDRRAVTAAAVVAPPPSAPATGKLTIEGKGIKRLVLLKIVGDENDPINTPIFQESPRSIENPEQPANQVVLERPGPTVSLPVGKYLLTGVELDGGFQSIVPSIYFNIDTGEPRARIWERTEFIVRQDKPCSIKVGTPFRPTVTATRRDSNLLLEYRLTDAGGHTYFCSAWAKPPAAVIDGKIVSGQQMFASKPSEKSPRFTISCNGREIGACSCDFGHAGNFWHSWRVPVSVLSGPLSIVASFDLGTYGHGETEPILVEWHWYYHFLPHCAGWILIIALLFLVKENRSWQAWTILILFFPWSEVIVPWFGRVNRMPREEIAFLQAIGVAWTAVWLLGPWLARCRPKFAAAVALVPVCSVGIAIQYWFQQSLLGLLREPGWLIASVVVFLPLLTAYALSAHCCRKSYHRWRFMLWLLFWVVVGFAVVVIICSISVLLWRTDLPPRGSSDFLMALIVGPLAIGISAYLLNLPFMILAFFCPLYRERFHKVLRLPRCLPPAHIAPEGTR